MAARVPTYRGIAPGKVQTNHSDQHNTIVSAITATESMAAANAMKTHLETIKAGMAVRIKIRQSGRCH